MVVFEYKERHKSTCIKQTLLSVVLVMRNISKDLKVLLRCIQHFWMLYWKLILINQTQQSTILQNFGEVLSPPKPGISGMCKGNINLKKRKLKSSKQGGKKTHLEAKKIILTKINSGREPKNPSWLRLCHFASLF